MEPGASLNIAYLYQKIFDLFSGSSVPSQETIMAAFSAFLIFIKPISLILSLLFLTGIIYCTIRIRLVLHEAEEKAHGAHHGAHHGEPQTDSESNAVHHETHSETEPDIFAPNKRWEKITEHINSEIPSDWRLAILECDIILEEMLSKMGYHGDTVSDKLKAVEKSDFLTIDKAWDAHKVRNSIAHEGINFQINDREAKRVVGLYADVFKEFHYI